MKNSMFVRTADTMHFSAVTGAVNGITRMISHTAMMIQESYIANGVMRRWYKCAKGSQSLYCCLYCYAYQRQRTAAVPMKMVGTLITPQANITTTTGTPLISTMAVCARIILSISLAAPAGVAGAVKAAEVL
nr:MAG TPA: hypothetical protein [Caudoviricetes sp.]